MDVYLCTAANIADNTVRGFKFNTNKFAYHGT
jgi:hypothetical protein